MPLFKRKSKKKEVVDQPSPGYLTSIFSEITHLDRMLTADVKRVITFLEEKIDSSSTEVVYEVFNDSADRLSDCIFSAQDLDDCFETDSFSSMPSGLIASISSLLIDGVCNLFNGPTSKYGYETTPLHTDPLPNVPALNDVYQVFMGGQAITRFDSSKPVLGTNYIVECIALAGYDGNGNAFITHYHWRNDIESSMNELLSSLVDIAGDASFDVRMISQNKNSAKFLASVLDDMSEVLDNNPEVASLHNLSKKEYLELFKSVSPTWREENIDYIKNTLHDAGHKIIEEDMSLLNCGLKSIAIDARSGEVYRFIPQKDLVKDPNTDPAVNYFDYYSPFLIKARTRIVK